MRAAILSIGDELVSGATNDTNAPWLADQLATRAVTVIERRTLGDDRSRIAEAMRTLASEVDLIVSTGGLGPTDDDLTREALGDVVTPGRPLVVDKRQMTRLERWYRGAKRDMPESNRRQATRPETAICLKNPNGTAPGLRASEIAQDEPCIIFVLPGPPHEMTPMFEQFVLPELPGGHDSDVAAMRLVHAYGLSESEAAERLGDLLARGRNPLIGITVSDAILTARIRGVGRAAEMTDALNQLAAEIEQKWSPYVYGRDDESLGASAGALLRQRGRTLATAESCTGGWLGKLIVDPAGSSDYYCGGWVTYSNEMKRAELGVPGKMLEAHGAVSRPVAAAMAEGAMERSGADFALSITGIAGPDGPPTAKPVGTVFVGISQRRGGTEVRHFRFPGDRLMVRGRSADAALQLLRFRLLGVVGGPLLWQVPESNDPPTDPPTAHLALGSNLGDRERMIRSALEQLDSDAAVEVCRVSTLIETDPVGVVGGPRYLNAAASIRTTLSPRVLLDRMLAIERRLGRDRSVEGRWGPRIIDLDLLLYADRIVNEPGLTVPHPRMHERPFVLAPLVEIAPDAVHPVLGRTIESLWNECGEGED